MGAVTSSAAHSPQIAPVDRRGVQFAGERSRALSPSVILVVLIVLGGVLRFATLDVQSAWLDESATITLVRRGLGGLLSHLSSSESTPPLYYVLVWAWTRVFGTGVVAFRSFSAMAGTLTIPVMYLAGRRVSPRVGLWAAALTAFNPAMYYYSQEARCYALLILFSAAAFVYWQRALDAGDGRSLAWWGALSVLALLTHYFAVFLFLPECALLARRLGARRLILPAGAVVLTGIALMPLAIKERSAGQADWIESKSLPSRVAEAAKQFLVGLNSPLELFSTALIGLLAAAALWRLWRGAGDGERRIAGGICLVGVCALLLPLVLSATHLVDVFDGRNVIAAWIPWAVLLAMAVGFARAGRSGAALGIAIVVVSLAVIAGVNALPEYQRDDWRSAAGGLAAGSSAALIVTPANGLLPLTIYMPGLHKVGTPLVRTREVEFVALRALRAGRSPLAPALPAVDLPGYRLVSAARTRTYAVARYRSAQPSYLAVSSLQKASGATGAEVLTR